MSNSKIFIAVFLFLAAGLGLFYLQNFDAPSPVSYSTPEEAYEQGRYFNVQNHLDPPSRERREAFLKSSADALRFAAERGHLKAASKLGEMYANGIGVGKDVVEALKWYEKGANDYDLEDVGNLLAICDLYRKGLGAPVNYSKALEYCQRAAQYVLPDAQQRLSDFYFSGWAVKKDNIEAYFWMKLANYWAVYPSTVGYDLAKEKKIAALLSEEEKQKVILRVKAWMPKDLSDSKSPELLQHCTEVLKEERAKKPVTDQVAAKCLRRCLLELRPQDPRFSGVEACPYWPWPYKNWRL